MKDSVWPRETTAFLMVHGMGQQTPFDTLDAFARTLYRVLEARNPGIQLTHDLKKRDGWTENYISFVKDGDPATVDIFEYYWAHETQRQITLAEVGDWLWKASGRDLRLRFAALLFRLIRLTDLSSGNPYSRVVRKIVTSWLGPIVVDSLGDVAIYTTTDIKSRHYPVRDRILSGAVERVRALLHDDRYPRVILAGHSLGSVIALDALNRINHRMNVGLAPWVPATGKGITALVTFGSPLDKVRRFFSPRRQGRPIHQEPDPGPLPRF